ncbi:hypothetical protein AC1031_013273 [Aphanomyces cochlioides]|nr:hypothetical protein AC1031_013273 [Aphanomyces cochlioides]
MTRLLGVLGANMVCANLTSDETSHVCNTLTGATATQLRQNANGNITLLRYNLFDPAYPSFHFAAWALVYDWATAYREAIEFQGDIGSVKVISAISADLSSLVNPLEIPVNVAAYIRYICVYVTTLIICVAILAAIYLLLSKGYVEGLNLFLELNRVAGFVWIGRTFLFVRSMAAICLLSTKSLVLVNINQPWLITSASYVFNKSKTDQMIRIFKTFIAAGEVSWLGFVPSDIFAVFTAQYTPAYVFKCNFLIWDLAAILSWTYPATHTATMMRECSMPQIDFQLVCSSGTVSIGSFSRFMSLVGVCIGSILACYLYERFRHPKLLPTRPDSLFLSTSAKYVFEPGRWMDYNLYRIDPGSAAINGLLSFHFKSIFYLFDVKLWRFVAVEESQVERLRMEREGKQHLLPAIPLIE